MTNTIEKEVWATVQALNRTWTFGEVVALRNYFYEDMVAITPMDPRRLEGREACYASWERFARNFKITQFEEREPKIQVYGETAVVTYYYSITFEANTVEANTVPQVEQGRDMFVMVRIQGKWLAVANQFSSLPKA